MSLSLTKGQGLSLVKPDGGSLTRVRLGLGWDAAPRKGLFGSRAREIDLDASAILFDANGREQDAVYFGQLSSRDGSIRHSGDNLTGDGDGDDEQIVVDLDRIPASIAAVMLVITSYSGQTFNDIDNVFARVVDISGAEREVVRFDLAEGGNHTGKVIAKLTREGSGWKFTAIGSIAQGKTFKDVLGFAKAAL